MRFFYRFAKSFKENLRDWKIIILVIVFAPFFVYMMYFYLSGSDSSSYNVAVLNRDPGNYSKELINEWKKLSSTLGRKVKVVSGKDTFSGIAEDIDDEGMLILRLPSGGLKKISAGDVIMLR